MKWILLSACGCLLLFTTGCMSSSEEWRGHANNARFGGFTMETPAARVVTPVGDEARAPVIVSR
jgi:hypothetical protein